MTFSSTLVQPDFYHAVMPGLPEGIVEFGQFMEPIADDVIKFGTDGGAVFDVTERYRYLLWRIWDVSLPIAMFIGLNPSTADHEKSDPTCTREMRFCRAWGYGAYVKGNLYGYRATKPKDMKAQADPTGPRNYEYILRALSHPLMLGVIAAWGSHARDSDEMAFWEVWNQHTDSRDQMKCLGTTKAWKPRHPLYLPTTSTPAPFWCKSRCVDPIDSGRIVAQHDTSRLQS